MNKAKILIDKTLANNNTGKPISVNNLETKSVQGLFVNNKIGSKLVKQLIDSESYFKS